MAVVFKNVKSRNIGASATAIGSYTVGAATSGIVTALTVSNVTASTTIKVNVSVYDGANDHYLVKGAELIPGAALDVIDGGGRLILNTSESVRVESDTATSADAVMSVLEYS